MLCIFDSAGRPPELFIRDDEGKLIEKIDLSKFKTEEIHALMVSKGFSRKVTGGKALRRG